MSTIKQYPDGRVTFGIKLTRKREPEEELPDLTQGKDAWDFMRVNNPDGYHEILPALGLSNVVNYHKPSRSRRGQTGISSHGKGFVKFAAEAVERRWGQRNTVMITTTLPPALPDLTPEQFAEAKRQFLQSLSRHASKHGFQHWIVSVTEIQERRWESMGGMPLHLHIVMPGRRPYGHWILTPRQVQDMWENAIRNATGNNEEIDWGTSTRIERIRKSASAYIGKYMSKGCSVTRKAMEQGLANLLPSSWYSGTRYLTKLYKRSIRSVSGQHVTAIGYWMIEALQECFSWAKWVEIPTGEGSKYVVGWVGILKQEWRGDKFWNLIKT